MEWIKKAVEIIKKLYRNIWFKTIMFCSIFLMFYAIRENINITNNTNTMLNLALVGIFFVLLYQRLYEKRISIVWFLFIPLTMFILNKLYDPRIFFNMFSIKLNYVVILVGVTIFLYIIGSKICVLIRNRKKTDSKTQTKNSSFKTQSEDEYIIGKIDDYDTIEYSRTNNFNKERSGINLRQERKKSQKSEPIVSANYQTNDEKNIPLSRKITDSNLFAIFIFAIIFLIPILFILLLLFNKNVIEKFNGMQLSNIINICISLIGLIFLCMFMWTVVIGVFIKLIQIIFSIMNKQNSQNSYLLNASAFLVVSYFITKQYEISLDKIIDNLAQGNILSVPIFLVILLPLFLTLLQNLESLIIKNGEIKKRTIKLLKELIFSIIDALLNFVKFTTADFLISIQEIVKADLDYEAETEIQSNEDLGEQVDGEQSNQSGKSEPNADKE